MKISIGGQAIGIGGTPLGLPLPRVTVSGKDFLRNGVVFRPFGVQPLYHEWIIAYFRTGGASERADVITQTDGAHNCGSTVMRMHLDLWDFISGSDENSLTTDTLAITNFIHMLDVARERGIYFLVSGNNCWKIDNVPAWYDALPYATRWDVQQYFFEQLAQAVLDSGNSTTVIGYELLSEPTITDNPDADWYWGDIYDIGLYYVQHIARGIVEASQPAVVQAWITQLSGAIKAVDPSANVTVGLISLGGPSFGPDNIEGLLDFLSPHLYPPGFIDTDVAAQIALAEMWAASPLPNLIGESANLNFTDSINREWNDAVLPIVEGYVTFFYGYPPALFTTPPEAPREWADSTTDALTYAIQKYSLSLAIEYREEFLAA
jgi:hypothetical protein